MFGGFGGGGFGGPPPGQQPGAPGFPGMQANVNVTHTTTTSSTSAGGMGGAGGAGGSDPSQKSKEMQDRYRYREDKLPTYIALVDVLESKGENVLEMRDAADKAKMTLEEMQKGQAVFEKVTAAAMSFDFSKIMQ